MTEFDGNQEVAKAAPLSDSTAESFRESLRTASEQGPITGQDVRNIISSLGDPAFRQALMDKDDAISKGDDEFEKWLADPNTTANDIVGALELNNKDIQLWQAAGQSLSQALESARTNVNADSGGKPDVVINTNS